MKDKLYMRNFRRWFYDHPVIFAGMKIRDRETWLYLINEGFISEE